MADRATKLDANLLDDAETTINPATEEKQDDIISGQLPDGHNVTVDNGAGANAVNIQDGGNTITVDGTVTANAGTNLNTSALALESGGNLDTIASDTTSIDGKVSTETKQDNTITELKNILGFQIPFYDEIVITYVAAGNGAGEIETVVYKLATSTVATLTLSYNASNELSGILKS